MEEVRKKAARYLKEIAADLRMGTIERFCWLLHFLFRRIFSDVQVDREGLAHLREVARGGPLVFVPCHRSHVDYLVLSYVLVNYGLMPPHIAAGANLDFWPIGGLFRRSGAFFLRRSFRDNRIYAETFRAYIRKLIKEGVWIEFFIEGGRSRTGKSLPPRFGLLGEIVHAVRSGAAKEVFLVPVGLSYERVIEGESYQRELSGAEKEKETLSALLKTPKVLTSRYGRLTMTFGEPLGIRAFARAHAPGVLDDVPAPEPSDGTDLKARQAELVRRLAYRVTQGINEVIFATPTALVAWALLANPGRGLGAMDLQRRVGFLIEQVLRNGLPLAPTLQATLMRSELAIEAARQEAAKARARGADGGGEYGPAVTIYEAIGAAVAPLTSEAVSMLTKGGCLRAEEIAGETIHRVQNKRRIAVDYYKNTLIHALIRECLLATAILGREADGAIPKTAAVADCAFLSRILKYEFIYDASHTFEEAFERTWSEFLAEGWVMEEDGAACIVRGRRPVLCFFRQGILNFIDAYHLACLRLLELDAPVQEGALTLQVVRAGEKAFAKGGRFIPEACSTALVKNAVKVFAEHGAATRRYEGKKVWVDAPDAEQRDRLSQLSERLAVWSSLTDS